jgi:predicted RNA polymerase sigma factor
MAERLPSVLHVLYLIFNEGYAPSTGPGVARSELSNEAIRLTRMLHASLPGHPEPSSLLALMLLTDARRPARTGPHDELIPLSKQGRQLWAPYVMPVVRAAWSQPIQPRSLPVSLGGFNQIGRIPRNRDRPDLKI